MSTSHKYPALFSNLIEPDDFPPRAADDCPQDEVKRSNNRAETEVILQFDVTRTKVHSGLTTGVVRDRAKQVGVKSHGQTGEHRRDARS